jgi:hypothetical protein
MINPFCLDHLDAYLRWRDLKLARRPADVMELLMEIRDPCAPSPAELRCAAECVERANMVLLQCKNDDRINKASLVRLGSRFGLKRLDDNLCADEDAVSTIRVSAGGGGNEYIPYTDRPLGWHTDGYYNAPDRQIRGWSLMCRQDAAAGGENALLDHEILYILLRDDDPEHIRALMAPDALTIPANYDQGIEIRPAYSGPVFSLDPRDGSLHMRYSARTRNIQWKRDTATQTAAALITRLFSTQSAYIYRHRLEPGQCLLSNNVLHNRSGFRDSPEKRRVIYRARYYDRIRV